MVKEWRATRKAADRYKLGLGPRDEFTTQYSDDGGLTWSLPYYDRSDGSELDDYSSEDESEDSTANSTAASSSSGDFDPALTSSAAKPHLSAGSQVIFKGNL